MNRNSLFNFLIYLFWFTYFKPPILERISMKLDLGWHIFHLFVFVIVFICSFNRTMKISKSVFSKFYIWLYVFLIWCGMCVLISSPILIGEYVKEIIHVIELNVVLHVTFHKKGDNAIVPITNIAIIYIVSNALSMLVFNHGFFYSNIGSSTVRAQWILGSKNTISMYVLIFLCIVQLGGKFMKKKYIYLINIIAFISIIFAGPKEVSFMQGSSVGIIACFINLIGYIFINHVKNRNGFLFLSAPVILIGIILMNCILLGGVVIPIVNDIITNVFHKSLDFSGRKLIWEFVFSNIADSPIIGHGSSKFGLTLVFDGVSTFTTYTYNMFLRLWLRYGIISIIIYCVLLLNLKEKNTEISNIIYLSIFSIAIIGTMNEVDLNNMLFPMIILEEISQKNASMNIENTINVVKRRKNKNKFL